MSTYHYHDPFHNFPPSWFFTLWKVVFVAFFTAVAIIILGLIVFGIGWCLYQLGRGIFRTVRWINRKRTTRRLARSLCANLERIDGELERMLSRNQQTLSPNDQAIRPHVVSLHVETQRLVRIAQNNRSGRIHAAS